MKNLEFDELCKIDKNGDLRHVIFYYTPRGFIGAHTTVLTSKSLQAPYRFRRYVKRFIRHLHK